MKGGINKMLLTRLKWLSWLIAVGLPLLLFLATLLTGRLGLVELMFTFMLAGIISVPGWIIHFAQKQKTQNTV
jgi:hypothetical protein